MESFPEFSDEPEEHKWVQNGAVEIYYPKGKHKRSLCKSILSGKAEYLSINEVELLRVLDPVISKNKNDICTELSIRIKKACSRMGYKEPKDVSRKSLDVLTYEIEKKLGHNLIIRNLHNRLMLADAPLKNTRDPKYW